MEELEQGSQLLSPGSFNSGSWWTTKTERRTSTVVHG
uniref:Uncharacterized protein n=1 Tax=Nelumbo nucifera TaxID=4432 RepID=A0A822ZM07_NELNU|nr:TPA_asm: hypothetical protein HUJ06_001018 [Nelumbo nucifera]